MCEFSVIIPGETLQSCPEVVQAQHFKHDISNYFQLSRTAAEVAEFIERFHYNLFTIMFFMHKNIS